MYELYITYSCSDVEAFGQGSKQDWWSAGLDCYIQLTFIVVATSLNPTAGETRRFEGSHRGYRLVDAGKYVHEMEQGKEGKTTA